MSVNKVIFVGRLGKDPEIRHTADNLAVANFSLATNRVRKDAGTSEYKQGLKIGMPGRHGCSRKKNRGDDV